LLWEIVAAQIPKNTKIKNKVIRIHHNNKIFKNKKIKINNKKMILIKNKKKKI